jgi:hypothetical protein
MLHLRKEAGGSFGSDYSSNFGFAGDHQIGEKRDMSCHFLPRRLFLPLISLLLLDVSVARAQDEKEIPIASTSPDGRFVFRKLGPGLGYGVVEIKSELPVPLGDETEGITPVTGTSIAGVWAPDGEHLAVNYRAGGRYETTQLYQWTGDKFEPMADLEELLVAWEENERAEFLKREKLPRDTYLRRIWDTFRTERWRDSQTVEVFVYSIRTFLRNKEDEEPEELQVSAVFTVRFGKDGNPRVMDRREASRRELGEE